MNKPAIVWLRQDLRVADNPALDRAVKRGGAVVPVFVWGPEEEERWAPGGASKWWLHQSLAELEGSLRGLGSRLVVRRGTALAAIAAVAKEISAGAVFWNRRYEPAAVARDAEVEEGLRAGGLEVESFNGALLHEPWAFQNQSGKPYRVFTPFWKQCLGQPDPTEPLRGPNSLAAPVKWPKPLALEELGLEPGIDWAGGLRAAWRPGEAGAKANLKRFLAGAFGEYAAKRDRPDLTGTSRLSPHLHFGEISPRQIWREIARKAVKRGMTPNEWRGSRFLAEIGWREFAHHLLYHFPRTPTEPLREEFKRFPWSRDAKRLASWQKGLTGYPIVDAGMRELWATGWMHNRARMIAASFLVKDLLVSWTDGAAWFWDTLVDADLAQNTLGWQWTAGCGADAAPYFRVFNPATQGEKFDPEGNYVRRWCPELAGLPARWIHRPSAAPPELLRKAGVELGRDYPRPMVSHAIARNVALEAFARIKKGS